MKIVVESRIALAAFFLCVGVASPEHAHAEARPAGSSFQLQNTLNELLGEEQAHRYREIIAPDELMRWQVYFPDGKTDALPGVMVYVSPHDSGQIDSRWRAVMDKQNLVYIAADESGNEVSVKRRMVLAVMAIRSLARRHAFAGDQMMISGFSGGGRVASMLAIQYPEVFTRALYICGVDFWEEKRPPDIERLAQNRFVFLTGARDFNRDETRTIHRRYLRAGVKNSQLMIIPGMSHAHPDGETLEQALLFLYGED